MWRTHLDEICFMKKRIFFLLILLLAIPAFAQQQPVSWKAEAVRVEGNTYEIRATGTMTGSWHIYDLTDYGASGPNGTIFTVEAGDKVRLLGEPAVSSTVHKGFDEVFGIEIGTCDSPVVICQRVELLQGNEVTVPVTVEWQACNDENCIPPDECTMMVTLPAGEGLPVVSATEPAAEDSANDQAPGEGKSIWGLILEAIAWGFVALLTPCVFPMIPMTVSFFLKQNQTAEGEEQKPGRGKWLAAAFGLSIVALYTIPIAVIILVTYFAGGATVTADIFNWLATHWLPNIVFFLIFMLFAASFFGAFEITLPNSWLNKSDSKSNSGGLVGVFFVALTLVLVSFSCTGPIVGSVLIKSTQGEFWTPMVTMLAFSVAFALPFTLFALFPELLKKLRSGSWLNSVKVVMGFIEVAFGFKFLSVADQTYHWGLLDREVYLAIWIVVFAMLGFYLLGKIRFQHDDPVEKIGITRLALSIAVFSFVVYMIPGMFGAPLKALSGYLPPIETQDFVIANYAEGQVAGTIGTAPAESNRYGLKIAHNLPGYFTLDEGLAAAKESGKPVFVDVTGHGCTNCREMEARVWSDPEVMQRLRDNFEIVALYTDDKQRLPENEWFTTPNGKTLKTLGSVNSYIARDRFEVNAQPNYLILSPEGEILAGPRGYNLSIPGFIEFLDSWQK